MVNTTYPELQETKTPSLPTADVTILKSMRDDMCLKSKDFKLQTQQRFLRRVLSPESPVRNLLMVHGTGTGKTCTAIQIAEEYVIRPEFQGKKVLILANPSVQDNFKEEVFSLDARKVVEDPDGLLLSKQCTGRRYLEMLQRAQAEPIRLSDQSSKQKLLRMAERLVGEFYEFRGYESFATYIDSQKIGKTPNDYNKWVHDNFDDRLIIVDEAHNLRVSGETSDASKLSALAIQHILTTAKGVVLVLLTATPMFDQFDEIIYYFNLFLWNDRRLDPTKNISVSEIFDEQGNFREGQEVRFRGWCQDYVSYIRGENPFTFPFRLPPPDNLIAEIDRTTDIFGEKIKVPRRYLKLTKSFVSPFQEKALKRVQIRATTDPNLICTYPDYKPFEDVFERVDNQLQYRKDVEKFLAPSKVGFYSSKFGLIMNMINNSTGLVFVYSNLVKEGADLFAMCLEEHGYNNAIADNFLRSTSGETPKGSKGKYVVFSGATGDIEIRKTLRRLKSRDNIDGSDIRVIIASPKVSEGVDFSFVRQIHVLDPWWNMSRIEQVLGRGMRTCSHSLLPFENQNCTVYLHVCRYPDSKQESPDEYIYRVGVEEKGARIARVKKIIMESSMDCELQYTINNLPDDWRNLEIPQIRVQDKKELTLTLEEMSAPTFEDTVTDLVCRVQKKEVDPSHVRPLSAILDIRDEVFDKLITLFLKKPIWSIEDLYKTPLLKKYSKDVLNYLIQNAIESKFDLKDKNGRLGKLRSTNNILSLTFEENDTLTEKLVPDDKGIPAEIQIPKAEVVVVKEVGEVNLEQKREAYEWPEFASEFDKDVLDWYILDSVLAPEERTKYLLSVDWTNPPVYASPLLVTMKNGKQMYVMGSKNIYNQEKQQITPIGEEEDAYLKWVYNLKNKFLENRETIFASMKESVIRFNIDEKSTDIRRAPRTKTIDGRACISFTEPVLNSFAEWLSGNTFPKSVATKKDRCMYVDLLIRRAILQKKDDIFWLTPQELEILNEDENRKDLLKKLK